MPVTFSRETLCFASEDGGQLSWSAARSALAVASFRSDFELRQLAERLLSGELDIDDFVNEVQDLCASGAFAAAWLGQGGIVPSAVSGFDPATFSAPSESAASLTAFLAAPTVDFCRRLVEGVRDGLVLKDSFLGDRLAAVGRLTQSVFEQSRRALFASAGAPWERRVSPEGGCCPECDAIAALGWAPAGSLPEIMDTACLHNCGCRFEASFDGESPAERSPAPAELPAAVPVTLEIPSPLDEMVVSYAGAGRPLGGALKHLFSLGLSEDAVEASLEALELIDADRNDELLPYAFATSMKVQSLLFPVDAYEEKAVHAWCKEHGYEHGKLDTTENYHRVRQFDPEDCQGEPRTIEFKKAKGVKAVVCARPAAENSLSLPEDVGNTSGPIVLVNGELWFEGEVIDFLWEQGRDDGEVLDFINGLTPLSTLPYFSEAGENWKTINGERVHFNGDGVADDGPAALLVALNADPDACRQAAFTVIDAQGLVHGPDGKFEPKDGGGGTGSASEGGPGSPGGKQTPAPDESKVGGGMGNRRQRLKALAGKGKAVAGIVGAAVKSKGQAATQGALTGQLIGGIIGGVLGGKSKLVGTLAGAAVGGALGGTGKGAGATSGAAGAIAQGARTATRRLEATGAQRALTRRARRLGQELEKKEGESDEQFQSRQKATNERRAAQAVAERDRRHKQFISSTIKRLNDKVSQDAATFGDRIKLWMIKAKQALGSGVERAMTKVGAGADQSLVKKPGESDDDFHARQKEAIDKAAAAKQSIFGKVKKFGEALFAIKGKAEATASQASNLLFMHMRKKYGAPLGTALGVAAEVANIAWTAVGVQARLLKGQIGVGAIGGAIGGTVGGLVGGLPGAVIGAKLGSIAGTAGGTALGIGTAGQYALDHSTRRIAFGAIIDGTVSSLVGGAKAVARGDLKVAARKVGSTARNITSAAGSGLKSLGRTLEAFKPPNIVRKAGMGVVAGLAKLEDWRNSRRKFSADESQELLSDLAVAFGLEFDADDIPDNFDWKDLMDTARDISEKAIQQYEEDIKEHLDDLRGGVELMGDDADTAPIEESIHALAASAKVPQEPKFACEPSWLGDTDTEELAALHEMAGRRAAHLATLVPQVSDGAFAFGKELTDIALAGAREALGPAQFADVLAGMVLAPRDLSEPARCVPLIAAALAYEGPAFSPAGELSVPGRARAGLALLSAVESLYLVEEDPPAPWASFAEEVLAAPVADDPVPAPVPAPDGPFEIDGQKYDYDGAVARLIEEGWDDEQVLTFVSSGGGSVSLAS